MIILNENIITSFINTNGGSKKNHYSQLRITINENNVYKYFGREFTKNHISDKNFGLNKEIYIEYSHVSSPIEFTINKIDNSTYSWVFYLSTNHINISDCFPKKTMQEKSKETRRANFFNNISNKLLIIDSSKIEITDSFTSNNPIGKDLDISGVVAQIKYPTFFKTTDPMTGSPYNKDDFKKRTRLHIFNRKTETAKRYIILYVKKSDKTWSIFLVDELSKRTD